MSAARAPLSPAVYWGFIALMAALTALFVVLGSWQMGRLGEKEAEIATITARAGLPPVALPEAAAWGDGAAMAALDYRPVTVTGTLDFTREVRVFTSLTEPEGTYSGPGYWLMTPLVLDDGGVVFLNRGFVPDIFYEPALGADAYGAGEVTLTGLARRAEAVGPFTPAADMAGGIEWVRTPARLAAMGGIDPTTVAPVYVDLPAGAAGALPQGGETKVQLSNRHLEYAVTWFGFALLTPVMLAGWIWRQRRIRG